VKKTRRPSDASKQPALNILFIGNSFTSRNDLPGMIAQLAAAAGTRLDHDLISAGGASLRRHWNGGAARAAIKRGGYDFVVLQEQSTLPIKNAARMRENVLLFDAAIKAAGARTVLYMTWARANAPQAQDVITAAYTSIGKEIGAIAIPAGEAWRLFLSEHKLPVLHDRDGSHPTLAGTFLAACTAAAVLLRCDVAALEVARPGLTPDEIKPLQAAAATTAAAFLGPASRG
jgi:hypothetical protein